MCGEGVAERMTKAFEMIAQAADLLDAADLGLTRPGPGHDPAAARRPAAPAGRLEGGEQALRRRHGRDVPAGRAASRRGPAVPALPGQAAGVRRRVPRLPGERPPGRRGPEEGGRREGRRAPGEGGRGAVQRPQRPGRGGPRQQRPRPDRGAERVRLPAAQEGAGGPGQAATVGSR